MRNPGAIVIVFFAVFSVIAVGIAALNVSEAAVEWKKVAVKIGAQFQ